MKTLTINELKDIINDKNNILAVSEASASLQKVFKSKNNFVPYLTQVRTVTKPIYVFVLCTYVNQPMRIILSDDYTLANHMMPGATTDKPCHTVFLCAPLHKVDKIISAIS